MKYFLKLKNILLPFTKKRLSRRKLTLLEGVEESRFPSESKSIVASMYQTNKRGKL